MTRSFDGISGTRSIFINVAARLRARAFGSAMVPLEATARLPRPEEVLAVYRPASRSARAAENRTTTSRGRWLSTTRLIRPSTPRLIAVTPQTGKPNAAPSHSKYVRSVDWVSCINSSRS